MGIPVGFNVGPGALVAGQSIYEASATPKHRIGERLQLGERVFYYAKAGASALTAGRLCSTAALMGASTTAQATIAIAAAAAVGDKVVWVTPSTTNQAEGLYDEGFMAIEDVSETYTAYLYRIKHNYALTAGSSSKILLYDPLHVALTTSDKATLTVNPFKNVITMPAAGGEVGVPIGVPPIAVAANYYFWIQTWGVCAIFSHDGGIAIGAPLVPATTTGGDLIAQAAGSSSVARPEVASGVFHTVADEDAGIVFLRIMP